jgi:hypothetical protein
MTLYAFIDEGGDVRLINHLGVRLGDEPEEILGNLDRDVFTEADVEHPPERVASDHRYVEDVREIDADTPGRFNADPKRLPRLRQCRQVDGSPSASTPSQGRGDQGFLHRHRRSGQSRHPPAYTEFFLIRRSKATLPPRRIDTRQIRQGTSWRPLPRHGPAATLFAVKGSLDLLAERFGSASGLERQDHAGARQPFPRHLAQAHDRVS